MTHRPTAHRAALRTLIAEDDGTTVIEPLIAIALLVATVAPLAAALLRVTLEHGPADLALATRASAAAAEASRATCSASSPPPDSTPPDVSPVRWVLTTEPGSFQGVRVVTVRVTDRTGRILTSLVAPCVSD